MKILRLFLAIGFLLANCDLTVVAQTAQQRQLQQQRYQQQQLQQQRYQRQQQLQARQRQLRQQQQQLRYKQQQLQQQRQTAALKASAVANANKKLAATRTNAVRRKTILNNTQQAQQSNRIGRNRALAASKPAGLASTAGPKTSIPPARSQQVIQAKAALRTNQLNTLRASLQTRLQAQRLAPPGGGGGPPPPPPPGGGGGSNNPPSKGKNNGSQSEGGAFSQLSQPGGLSSTEGKRIATPEGKYDQSVPAHALTKHGPDVSKMELNRRILDKETKQATKYSERAIMEKAIYKNLQANDAAMKQWATTAKAGTTKAFEDDPQMGNLGIGVKKGPDGKPIPINMPLKKTVVVVMSDGKGGFHIQSSYPKE